MNLKEFVRCYETLKQQQPAVLIDNATKLSFMSHLKMVLNRPFDYMDVFVGVDMQDNMFISQILLAKCNGTIRFIHVLHTRAMCGSDDKSDSLWYDKHGDKFINVLTATKLDIALLQKRIPLKVSLDYINSVQSGVTVSEGNNGTFVLNTANNAKIEISSVDNHVVLFDIFVHLYATMYVDCGELPATVYDSLNDAMHTTKSAEELSDVCATMLAAITPCLNCSNNAIMWYSSRDDANAKIAVIKYNDTIEAYASDSTRLDIAQARIMPRAAVHDLLRALLS